MIEITNNIIAFDWTVLIIAGLIAIMGLWCGYRYKSGSLFAMFCIVIGAQEVLMPDTDFISGTALFYFSLSTIYIITSCIFYFLNSTYLTITSILIASYLLAVSFWALNGAEPVYYEPILGTMWAFQLIGSLFGVLNGYRLLDGIRCVISDIWNNIALRYHKGI